MSKQHDVEKARYWQAVTRDAARHVEEGVLPAAEAEGESVLLVAAPIEARASARFPAPRVHVATWRFEEHPQQEVEPPGKPHAVEWIAARAFDAGDDIVVAPERFESPEVDRGELVVRVDDEDPLLGGMPESTNDRLLVVLAFVAQQVDA